jgi:hypothetical protein
MMVSAIIITGVPHTLILAIVFYQFNVPVIASVLDTGLLDQLLSCVEVKVLGARVEESWVCPG